MATANETLDLSSLARAVRDGSEPAFRRLFETLYSPLVSYSTGITGSAENAEDVVQEAFVRFWQRRNTIDPGRSIRALLYATVRNASLNVIRTRSTHTQLLKQMTTETHTQPDPGSIDYDRLRHRLIQWIDGLPDREREAFRLSRFAELTHHEIAEVMDISKSTVEKHITNALKRLRDRIRHYDPELLKS